MIGAGDGPCGSVLKNKKKPPAKPSQSVESRIEIARSAALLMVRPPLDAVSRGLFSLAYYHSKNRANIQGRANPQ
ncbi:protein of unknown function (plasmid) [Methylocella tundrae]|uniref:Uncharacterized protein n=1 Tax=Methylocella tundrae TaxID=227605 RepID=A0A4U8Z7A6_METTU|nr:protein of unknown function [Methylocella tundrae]